MPVLMRPDGAVQVGWDPRRALLVHPPDGLSAAALADLLRVMQSGVTLTDLQALAVNRGVADAAAVAELVASLVGAGIVTTAPPPARSASIRIHGRGPLSDLLAGALRCSGARVRHSSLSHAGVRPGSADLVVLSDYLVTDPRVVRDLHEARVPHLPVRVRDGTGSGRPAGHSRDDELPAVRRSAPQRSRRGLARAGGATTRRRRQCRPGHHAGHRGAGAQPGRPRHQGHPRRRRPVPGGRSSPPPSTPRWRSTSAPGRR